MNQKLADPYNTQMLASWDRFFNRQVPKVVKRCKKDLFKELKKFHTTFSEGILQHGVPAERIENVVGDLSNHFNELETLDQTLTRTLQDLQRNISREITPAIQSEMNQGYTGAANQSGSGTHARQKAHLEQHTSRKKVDMFKQVTTTLIAQCFDVLIPGISKGLEEVVNPTLKAVRVLYSTFFKESHEKIEISPQERERLQGLLSMCKHIIPEGIIAADEVRITKKKQKEKKEEKAEFHECAVCLESPPDDPVTTPCSHVFCKTCLQSWLEQSQTCPNCRRDLKKGDLRPTGRRNKPKKRKSRPDTFQIEAPKREEPKVQVKKVVCRFLTALLGAIDAEFPVNTDVRVLRQLVEGFVGRKVKLMFNNKKCPDNAKLKKYVGAGDVVSFAVK